MKQFIFEGLYWSGLFGSLSQRVVMSPSWSKHGIMGNRSRVTLQAILEIYSHIDRGKSSSSRLELTWDTERIRRPKKTICQEILCYDVII